ncbi:unnamed protein product [Moneuplotes crassus]|uniref:Uncharacterized protein n=1 Tax=Euplotes crassus TaxID=5936 RepID=A0AAD1XMP7_EUPCR|nr:unnamed protein product [Moneuplotes crassus]
MDESYYNQFKIKGVEENANFNVVRCSLYFDNKMSKDKGKPKQHNIFEFLGVSRRGSCQKSYVKNHKVSPLAASGLLNGSKCEGRSSFAKNIPKKPERGCSKYKKTVHN